MTSGCGGVGLVRAGLVTADLVGAWSTAVSGPGGRMASPISAHPCRLNKVSDPKLFHQSDRVQRRSSAADHAEAGCTGAMFRRPLAWWFVHRRLGV